MALIEDLKWRYATKKMNGQKVPSDKLAYILEATRLSASSSGLQPYEIFVISNADLKAKIHPVAYGQPQILDSSHILVFAAWDTYTEERVNAVFSHMNAQRGVPDSATDDYRKNLLSTFAGMSEEEQHAHAAKQSYIALGTALAAAAEQRIDATPMEGFDKAGLDEVLDLAEKGLKSATILALGFRDEENDWLVNMKKVRTPEEKFFTHL